MSEHTPGPWHYQPKESAVKAGASETVAELQFCLPLGRTPANGCLIAAAPDMLAALQELEEFLDNQADVDDGIPNDAMRRLVEVRAAIAKATGASA